MFWFALPALMLHQFEEYVFPGGFRKWMNSFVYQSENPDAPLTKKLAFVINIVIGWPVFAAVGYVGQEQMWFTLPMLGILFVNAWFHIALSVSHQRYSPGTFTAMLVLIPLSLYAFYYYAMTWEIGFRLLLISLLTGIVFHLLVAVLPREWAQAREHRRFREAQDQEADPKH